MEIRNLIQDQRAVSPVIGVILMVAITVILAAVIGTFVLGLGESVQTTPQAKFTFDYQSGQLSVTHDGGDSIVAADLSITSSTAFDYVEAGGTTWNGSTYNTVAFEKMTSNSEAQAGTSVTVGSDSDDAIFDSATVRVVWNDPNTDKSATLGKWTGPNV